MQEDESTRLLHTYQEAFRIPERLLRELAERDALPSWARAVAGQREDWLASLHKNVSEGFPAAVRQARAGLLERALNLGATVLSGSATAIVIPTSAPIYCRALLEIATHPLTAPGSPDPNAKMLFDDKKLPETVRQLEHLLGMLAETGYLASADETWGGAVILASRFLYYHELGHAVRDLTRDTDPPSWILPSEEPLMHELVADQFALGMLTLELRHHAIWQPAGFSGVALAIGFVALKEYCEREYDGGVRRIKDAAFRMGRLLHWARISVDIGTLTEEAVAMGRLFWEQITGLLRRVERIPSPIFSLLLQTADNPREDWRVASNHLLKWCVFGDRTKVLTIVRNIRNSATAQAQAEARARRVLDVLEFILEDTAQLEPTLGLKSALQ